MLRGWMDAIQDATCSIHGCLVQAHVEAEFVVYHQQTPGIAMGIRLPDVERFVEVSTGRYKRGFFVLPHVGNTEPGRTALFLSRDLH